MGEKLKGFAGCAVIALIVYGYVHAPAQAPAPAQNAAPAYNTAPAQNAAPAQNHPMPRLASYEGPESRRAGAIAAYQVLQDACPRFVSSSSDILDYSLHVGLPGMKNIYGKAAEKFQASEIVMVVIRIVTNPFTIPPSVLPHDHFSNVALFDGGDVGGIIINDPLGLWLCERTPPPGQKLSLINAPQLTAAMAR